METRKFIVDVETKYKNTIMRALKRLVWVIDVQDGGEYRHCNGYSQIHIETKPHIDEDYIDNWTYNAKAGTGFIGVIEKDFSQSLAIF